MIIVLPFILIGVCVILNAVFWIKMLNILESKGYETNGLVRLKDYSSFLILIENEKNEELKKKYKRILRIQVAMIPCFFIGFLLFVWLKI